MKTDQSLGFIYVSEDENSKEFVQALVMKAYPDGYPETALAAAKDGKQFSKSKEYTIYEVILRPVKVVSEDSNN